MTKAKYIIIFAGLAAVITSCEKNHDNTIPSLGIEYSDISRADSAIGIIVNQDFGQGVDYEVDKAWVAPAQTANHFVLKYVFTGSDSLKLVFRKVSPDYNVYASIPPKDNVLLSAIFNTDSLIIDLTSSLSLKPFTETNTLNTVLNLYTLNMGNFNGSVDKVVLVRQDSGLSLKAGLFSVPLRSSLSFK